MWKGNYKEWAVPQSYQDSVLSKVGFKLYLFRSSNIESTYEDNNTQLVSDDRFSSFELLRDFMGFIDFSPTRKILGKFKSVKWQLDPSGSFFLPDKSQLITAYFPLKGMEYNTYDYILVKGEDVPHIGTTMAFRIVETVTEGIYMPMKVLVGLSIVADQNLIEYLEKLTHFN